MYLKNPICFDAFRTSSVMPKLQASHLYMHLKVLNEYLYQLIIIKSTLHVVLH